jgi:signal transduction histidine kinase
VTPGCEPDHGLETRTVIFHHNRNSLRLILTVGYLGNHLLPKGTYRHTTFGTRMLGTMTSERKSLIGTGIFILVLTGLLMLLPRGRGLTTFGNITSLLLLSIAALASLRNAISNRGQTRLFWSLLSVGCWLWAINQGLWTYFEVYLQHEIPDPFIGDVILFVHVVPFMAAVALRPHRPQEERKLYFATLNFAMLLIWWVFLYAFIVFPDEYVMLNVGVYSSNYDLLYLVENMVLVVSLAILTMTTKGGWKSVYRNLFIASALYALSSEVMNSAIARGLYYTGSLYDALFSASVCAFILVAVQARGLDLPYDYDPPSGRPNKWMALTPRLAMIAILSLPVMGFWAMFVHHAPDRLRNFRLMVTLTAMLVLGACLFLRQYLLDRQLMKLLESSHQSLENLQRLQSQLVQKEKLASLGQLVAGAAHEINNPLAAILGYSELLADNKSLNVEQSSMAQKIGQQARRTRDLVAGLLSFAQQSPSEKSPVDMASLLQRVVNMKAMTLEGRKVQVKTSISRSLPAISGNANQLFQCCLQVIDNAADALEEVGGGILEVSLKQDANELVLEFSDNGPGIQDPKRVFDPFYTTKAIGKGTGLGLSATYGVVQDHNGQITCHNNPEGGAVFVMRFPIAFVGSGVPRVQVAKA